MPRGEFRGHEVVGGWVQQVADDPDQALLEDMRHAAVHRHVTGSVGAGTVVGRATAAGVARRRHEP
jgi:hypothetical protein